MISLGHPAVGSMRAKSNMGFMCSTDSEEGVVPLFSRSSHSPGDCGAYANTSVLVWTLTHD